MILISFGSEFDSTTHLVRTSTGYHMGQLSEINYLCHQISDETMHIDDASLALDRIRLRSRPDGILGHPFLNSQFCFLTMFALHSFLLCLVGFRGKLFESLMAGLIAIVVGVFVLISERYTLHLILCELIEDCHNFCLYLIFFLH